MTLTIPSATGKTIIRLTNVRYAPELHTTLISIARLAKDANITATFSEEELTLFNASGKSIGSIPCSGNVYALRLSSPNTSPALTAQATSHDLSLFDVHCMYGHANYGYIKKMIENGQLQHLKIDPKKMDEIDCLACKLGKAK